MLMMIIRNKTYDDPKKWNKQDISHPYIELTHTQTHELTHTLKCCKSIWPDIKKDMEG